MRRSAVLEKARERFLAELERSMQDNPELKSDKEVVISGPLSSKEAIGEPERDDFPILRGKEVLMRAVFRGSSGQAFTSAAKGYFRGSPKDVLELPLQSSFERALLVSTMNAMLKHLQEIEGTVHCKNDGPGKCASCLKEWLEEQRAEKVGLVGMQPAFLEALVEVTGPENVMAADLAVAGKTRFGVKIMDGMDLTRMFQDCDLILATGSTLANGTIDKILEHAERYGKRVVFYGTTIAGAAYLLGLERWCPCFT